MLCARMFLTQHTVEPLSSPSNRSNAISNDVPARNSLTINRLRFVFFHGFVFLWKGRMMIFLLCSKCVGVAARSFSCIFTICVNISVFLYSRVIWFHFIYLNSDCLFFLFFVFRSLSLSSILHLCIFASFALYVYKILPTKKKFGLCVRVFLLLFFFSHLKCDINSHLISFGLHSFFHINEIQRWKIIRIFQCCYVERILLLLYRL